VRLFGQKTEFYDLLDRHGDNIVRMCEHFAQTLADYTNLEVRQAALKDLEHEGDHITHELFSSMHATLVTPLDKDDIAALAGGLDDIADYVDAAGDRFLMYRIAEPTPEAREMATLLLSTARLVVSTVHELRKMSNRDGFFRAFREIHELENQSDAVYRRALSSLFNTPGVDPIFLLKWREIYERIEMAVDKCEDVANVVESVILKYA